MNLLDLTPSEMEAAYLEYRKACYHILHRSLQEEGFMDHLATAQTVAQLASQLGIPEHRQLTLDLILRALVRFGAVAVVDGEPVRYVRASGFTADSVTLDQNLIPRAIGNVPFDTLTHSRSYQNIPAVLRGNENPVTANFVGVNMDLWNEFLQLPFYDYFREVTVSRIARPGARVLDLAAGPGFGLERLSRMVGPEGLAFGVEISPDFVREAGQRIQNLKGACIVGRDLEEGLDFLRDSFFEGAMIVGALHFIRNRDGLFREVSRVLRLGGRFCVSYVYLKRGSYDQELMDLRFTLREPKSEPLTRSEILELGARHGFKVDVEEMAIGCFGWFLFEKA